MSGTARARRRSRRKAVAGAGGLALCLVLLVVLPASVAAGLPDPWVCEPVPSGVRCVAGDEVILCPAEGVGRHECRETGAPPSEEPSPEPTSQPPSEEPTPEPTSPPSQEPTDQPSPQPSTGPTEANEEPTQVATAEPTDEPTTTASNSPTPVPSTSPSTGATPAPSEAATDAQTPSPEPSAPASPPAPSEKPDSPSPDPDPDPGPGPGPDPDPAPGPRPQPGDPSERPEPTPVPSSGRVGTTVLSADGHTGTNGPVSVTTSLITAAPGDQFVLTGDGWLPGSQVEVLLFSTPVLLGTAEVDSNGNFRTEVGIPEDVPAGEHHLVIDGFDPDGLPRRVSIPMTVLAAHEDARVDQVADRSSDRGGALPATGGQWLWLLAQAGAALAMGAMLLAAARPPGTLRIAAPQPVRRRSRSG